MSGVSRIISAICHQGPRLGVTFTKSLLDTLKTSDSATANIVNSGALVHGSSFTITGTGFGTKSVLTPTVRDIGATAAGSLDSQWSGATPNTGTSSDNMVNRADGFRSVSVPHSFVTRFLAGRHNVDTERSAQVGVWKDFTLSSPMYIYASFYFQVDASWDFNLDATDQNFKLANYGTSGGGIDSNTWYYEYRNNVLDHSFQDTTSPCQWHINDDKSPPSIDTASSNWYGSDTPNPSGTWQKVEMEILVTSSAGAGYVKGWVNGASAINVTNTRTDGIAGTGRSFQIMSYARQKPGVNQYRYVADVYMDIGTQACARVVLANNSVLANATIIEPQVPIAWSDTSLTFNVWKGKHSSGSVYAFVKNPSNSWGSAIGPLTMS